MQGRLKKIRIEGFRSLKSVDIDDLPQLTVLIGANGAGKSNFIRFFDMVSWMLRGQNLQEFIGRQGGGSDQLFMGERHTPRLNASIGLETDNGLNEYRFSLVHVPSGDALMFVDEAYRFSKNQKNKPYDWVQFPPGGFEAKLVEAANSRKADKSLKIVVDLLRRCVAYQFHDTSLESPIKQAWDVTDNVFLRSNGGNLASVLLHLRQEDFNRYKLIEKQIARVLPVFTGFELEPLRGRIQLRWRNKYGDKTIGAHLTSDGSLRLFCLVTLLNLPTDMLPDVLLLDEPELGLHPQAIQLVAAMIQRVAVQRQVVFATQSPYMVDCFDIGNIVVADLQDGATSLRKLDKSQYQAWLDEDYSVSDVWLSNMFGGQP